MKAIFLISLACTISFAYQAFSATASGINKQADSAVITGWIKELKDGDTILMNLYKFGEFQGCDLSKSTITSQVKRGRFSFQIPLSKDPQYIDLLAPSPAEFRISSYLIEPGDRILVSNAGGRTRYCGHGSEKWRLKEETDRLIRNYVPGRILNGHQTGKFIGSFNRYIEKVCNKIAGERSQIGVIAADIMIADLIGVAMHMRSMELFDYFKGVSTNRTDLQNYDHLSINRFNPDAKILKYADYYAFGVIEEFKLDSCFLTGKAFVVEIAYRYLKKRYFNAPAFRDRLLTLLLYTSRKDGLRRNVLDDAIATVKDPLFLRLLDELRQRSANGAIAADFALPDSSGKLVHLTDFRNKVILIDFWFSTCGPCKSLGVILNDLERKYIGRNVVFISVSVDKSKDRWISAIRKKEFVTDYSINLFTEGKALNHPLAKHYNINSCPTLLLIDSAGKINNSFVEPHEDHGAGLILAIDKMLMK
ncbi:Thiol-disulfide isomerase or thioredoxin [Mucilaginibacter gossypiicola]|uniref:Thiol-disulfide isomerase or thioredoxin n=1 Tax=Mucilaginibacter gossypiicola TaxID=551995 RepID=A0A1H8LW83_9SPHI|nr:TlpA disulfide reductase family protein [Mucilaginibacter gossypiicola]SEO09290.1 Thiol-disulfide isomerase or thioredoxin [Mucilaginibacter gossypiicola]